MNINLINPYLNVNEELYYAFEEVSKRGARLNTFNNIIKSTKEIVIRAVINWGEAVQFTSDELKDDIDVALEAVKSNGFALKFLSKRMQDNEKVVSAAVKNFGLSIQYASPRLKNKIEIILEAIKENGFAYKYIGAELKNTQLVIYEAYKSNKAVRFHFPRVILKRLDNGEDINTALGLVKQQKKDSNKARKFW